MIRIMILLLATVFGGTAAFAAVEGKEVTYTSGATTMKGYLATDDAIRGQRPGVLVVHEWWGQNAYARKRADMLAALGYTALALDMYGDGKTADHPKDAGAFSSAVMKNLPEARARFDAALALLKQQPNVDPTRIAAIGYCFGGAVVLEMAREGVELDAVASFHGSLAASHRAEPGTIKVKRILVANGAADKFIKAEDVAALTGELAANGVAFDFLNLPGAVHSFTNPDSDALGKKFGLPLGYNAAADHKSWEAMRRMFAEVFK
ncbi:dienelactone hydrolase family protein [Geopsychrobacter electrodiphilus]|uniref:dienelactone hydrolase family protein n=1 Tax=Geopsychrobacter electrodiphilus TaxID=225196 RepID=UPI0003801A23|nr:dienelactone hydrolase family protein [Geopsychrobacter electrodiphilus]